MQQMNIFWYKAKLKDVSTLTYTLNFLRCKGAQHSTSRPVSIHVSRTSTTKTKRLAITTQEPHLLGFSEIWLFWACLNCLKTVMGISRAKLVKWGYKTDGDPATPVGRNKYQSILFSVVCGDRNQKYFG